ncbi:hypothetical protein SMA90_27130, partial [Escherichia coli]
MQLSRAWSATRTQMQFHVFGIQQFECFRKKNLRTKPGMDRVRTKPGLDRKFIFCKNVHNLYLAE